MAGFIMATTTNYSWSTPDNTAYVKDGASAIRTLGSSVDTTLYTALGGIYPGLRLVKKQVIGSGVSSVNVTGAFSGTYTAYKIIISGGVGSTTATLAFQLGAANTNYEGVLNYANYVGTVATPAGSSGANFQFAGSSDTNAIPFTCEVNNPFLAQYTNFESNYIATANAGKFIGRQKSTTSFTDFTITASAGTLTGGTIYVYGYGIS
jgi:hypothetical protein